MISTKFKFYAFFKVFNYKITAYIMCFLKFF